MTGPAAGRAAGPPAGSASTGRRVRWAGPLAFLVECATLTEVVALHARLAAAPLPGQVEALAAAETVTLSFTHRGAAVAGADEVRHWAVAADAFPEGRAVEIEVVYDGADLAEVAAAHGLSPEALVRWHAETSWVGAFGGFAPGFTYVTPEEPGDSAGTGPLDIRRRSSPRTSVTAGSVAVAGRFSAVYPRDSPGGWQLIGRTDARMWDLGRTPPALVSPGDRVRYRAVREVATVRDAANGRSQGPTAAGARVPPEPAASAGPGARADSSPPPGTGPALIVEHPGMQSLLEDLGRAGHGDLGVPTAGAADAASARQANRIVGNAPDAAVVETLLGGLALRARGHHVLALTGAEGAARITTRHRPSTSRGAATPSGALAGAVPADRAAPPRTPFALYDGEVLTIGQPEAGLRTYVAVRGGLDAPATLGSASTDTLSGLGPAPLSAGTEAPVRGAAGGAAVGTAEEPLRRLPHPGATTVLRVTPGPREDWFGAAGLQRLTGQDWEVGHQSNRIGVRLEVPEGSAGEPLERTREGELASEGTVAGALQVPPSGLPVVFLADHPVTGGYPVIGVVVPQDLILAAQLPPGALVRFMLVDPEAPDEPRIRED